MTSRLFIIERTADGGKTWHPTTNTPDVKLSDARVSLESTKNRPMYIGKPAQLRIAEPAQLRIAEYRRTAIVVDK